MNKSKTFILITGGASGIGLAIAKLFSKQYKNIIILDKDSNKLKKVKEKMSKQGANVLIFNVDLSNSGDINNFIDTLERGDIKINFLINNAGYQENIDVLELSEKDIHKIFCVNLYSAFLLSKYLAKKMIKNKLKNSGIINITSIHSDIVRGIAHYSASKAALQMLTKELAIRLAEQGIRVNSIAPGAINTPLLDNDLHNSKLKSKASLRIPMKRLGRPEEVAYLAEFLASNKANYITGSTFIIDGGLSLVI